LSSPPKISPESRPAAIDHVQLAAPRGCEERAREFYGGVLGLTELEKPEALRGRGGVWFALASGQVHIGVQEPFTPARQAHPALRVPRAGFEALADRLAAAGARVQSDDLIDGVKRFFTDDPWGNRLELVESAGADSIEDLLRKSSGVR